MKSKQRIRLLGDILGVLGAVFIFIIPFMFILLNSLKDRKESNKLSLSLPHEIVWTNFKEAIETNHYQVLTGFKNSLILTFFTVLILTIICAMAGYVIQRRQDRVMNYINSYIMIGMMMPLAIIPTIWVLQSLHIYKTMFSMIMIDTALQIPVTTMLYRGFFSTIPRELEEAGYVDGCTRLQMFTRIILPLLKPIMATVIIVNACYVFNDFTNPLYFLPGSGNATVQLTLYNFIGKYASSYNLLFADVVIITVPMLILFLVFNKQLIAGMTMGAVKG